MVQKLKKEIPSGYFNTLPEFLRREDLDEELLRLRNSILWCLYLYDLSEEEKIEILKELLKKDYLRELKIHVYLDPINILVCYPQVFNSIVDELRNSLEVIKKQKFTDLDLIRNLLLYTWSKPVKLSNNEYKLLVEICRNPAGSFRDWSKATRMSLSGVKYVFDRLTKKVFLKITCLLNLAAIKLRHFFVQISDVDDLIRKRLRRKIFEIKWCRSVFDFASDIKTFFISLFVPNHAKCVKTFIENVKKLKEFGDVRIYEIKEMFTSHNLSLYDPDVGWKFTPSDWALFSLSDTPKDYLDYLKQITPFRKVVYNSTPKQRFSKKDLLLIANLEKNFRIKRTLLSKITEYSLSLVSRRRKEFVEKGIICPDAWIVNIGLDNDATVILEEKEDVEYFVYAAAEFPRTVGYRIREIFPERRNFLWLYFRLPSAVLWDIIQSFSDIATEINLGGVFYEYKGTYASSVQKIFDRWDEERQQWIWYEEDFSIL